VFSLLVGALFKKFGLLLNTPRIVHVNLISFQILTVIHECAGTCTVFLAQVSLCKNLQNIVSDRQWVQF
jgi:hypothetical protein